MCGWAYRQWRKKVFSVLEKIQRTKSNKNKSASPDVRTNRARIAETVPSQPLQHTLSPLHRNDMCNQIQLTVDAFRNGILLSTIYININAKHGSVQTVDSSSHARSCWVPNGAFRWTSAFVFNCRLFERAPVCVCECVSFWLVNFDKRKVSFYLFNLNRILAPFVIVPLQKFTESEPLTFTLFRRVQAAFAPLQPTHVCSPCAKRGKCEWKSRAVGTICVDLLLFYFISVASYVSCGLLSHSVY